MLHRLVAAFWRLVYGPSIADPDYEAAAELAELPGHPAH